MAGGGGGGGGAKVVTAAVLDCRLLSFIVCPLSKRPLRYCEKSQELISASIGVAYPVVDGIPLLAPAHGRILDAAAPAPPPSLPQD